LRAAGESVNRRLCEAEAADAKPAPDVATFYHVTRPSTTQAGLHAPGLRFGEPRVMAVLGALVGFAYLVAGFANRQLVKRVGALLHAPYGPRQATYDLRRLQRKGLIAQLPRGHTYRLTSVGRRVAVLFTKAYGRVLAPGRSALDLHCPDDVIERRPLSRTWRSFDKALDDFVEQPRVADGGEITTNYGYSPRYNDRKLLPRFIKIDPTSESLCNVPNKRPAPPDRSTAVIAPSNLHPRSANARALGAVRVATKI
jgi:hypothetical protein